MQIAASFRGGVGIDRAQVINHLIDLLLDQKKPDCLINIFFFLFFFSFPLGEAERAIRSGY